MILTKLKINSLLIALHLLCCSAVIAQQDTLYKAIQSHEFDLAEQMILNGEDIHIVDKNGANALLWACRKGNLKLVKLLVEHGADLYPDGAIYNDSKNWLWGSVTAAAVAANSLEIIKYLIEEQNFPIDEKAYSIRAGKRVGSTTLRWALRIQNSPKADSDRTKIIDYLLEKGAEVTTTRKELALYRRDQGRFSEAIALLKEEIEIPSKKGNFWTMYMHYELAATYRIMGSYSQAISIYLNIIDYYEKIEDFHGQIYIAAVNRLGVTYREIGDYEKAEYYLSRSAQLYKERLGDKHRDYLINAHSLATLYREQGKYRQELDLLVELTPSLQQTIGLSDERLRTDSIHYYNCLYDIASNPEYQKQNSSVIEQLKETASFYRSRKSKVDYADNLKSIGRYYANQDRYQQAHSYYKEALTIVGDLYAPSQKYNRNWQIEMAQVEEKNGDIDSSSKRFAAVNKQTKIYIQNLFSNFSEREQQAMSQKEISFFDKLKSYHYRHHQFSEEIFDNELFLRGLLLRNKQHLVNQLRKSDNTAILAKYEQWLSLKKLVTTQLTLPINKIIPNLEELKLEMEALESELARSSALFSKQQTLPTWTSIRDHLKEGEAAIQVTHFKYHEPFRKTDSIFYIAQIIQPNISAPISVFLCEEKELKKLLKYPNKKKNHSNEGQLLASRGIVPKGKKQVGLESIWKKLLPYLTNTHTLFISNSGIFNELNIGATPIEEDQLVIDKFQLHQYLNLSKILYKDTTVSYNNNYLLIGGVDYNSTKISQKSSEVIKGWDFLKGTQKEVRSIYKMIQKTDAEVQLLEQQSATEDSLKSLLSKSISPKSIHIATHGFFFPKVIQDSNIYERRLPFAIAKDPMIRSGLILANANYTWSGQTMITDEEDGILTAKEVADLHLENTELVILSACQTGLGDLEGNEGVYGLQRGFKQAGARYLILSLWEVPDKETAWFMETFYEYYLEQEMPIRAAFNATQQAMRIQYDNPYQWAGFVLIE